MSMTKMKMEYQLVGMPMMKTQVLVMILMDDGVVWYEDCDDNDKYWNLL